MASTSASATSAEGQEISGKALASEQTVAQLHERAPEDLRSLYEALDFGTGDLEVAIGNQDDLKRAQDLITASYQAS